MGTCGPARGHNGDVFSLPVGPKLSFCDLFGAVSVYIDCFWRVKAPASAALVCETGSDARMFPLTPQSSMSSMENSRPVGQVDKHVLLLVHGVGNAGESECAQLRALDSTHEHIGWLI